MTAAANSSKKENIYSATFSSFCQDVSKFRLSHMIRIPGVVVEKLPYAMDSNANDDWMVVVFAHSKFFRLTIKIHFRDTAARLYAKLCRGDPSGPDLSITAINDFMREYGNQLVGAVKQSIENHSGYAKVSCPLVTRGQDAPFFSPNPASSAFEDHWLLKAQSEQIRCSIALEFLDRNFMREIFLPAFFDIKAIGDVEFFE